MLWIEIDLFLMCYAIEKEWLDNNTCQDIQWCLCKQCDYKILKKIKPDMHMSILIKKKQLNFDEIWIYRSLCYEILEMSLIWWKICWSWSNSDVLRVETKSSWIYRWFHSRVKLLNFPFVSQFYPFLKTRENLDKVVVVI